MLKPSSLASSLWEASGALLKLLKTFRTKDNYTPKLIWMTLKKYQKKLFRNKDFILQIKESLFVTPTNKSS